MSTKDSNKSLIEELESHTVAELKEILRNAGLKVSGSKSELIMRNVDMMYHNELTKLKVTELRELLDQYGIARYGTKDVLISKLETLENDQRAELFPHLYGLTLDKDTIKSKVNSPTKASNENRSLARNKDNSEVPNLFVQIILDPNEVNNQTKAELSDLETLVRRLNIVLQSQFFNSPKKDNIKVSILINPDIVSVANDE